MQRSMRDTYDHDPTTASMYDDCDKQKTYSAPGQLNWKFAGGPKAEFDAAQAANKKKEGTPVEALMQRFKRDTFDGDSGSTSMYDDGHVYSEAGQFRPAPPSENKKKADTEKLNQISRRDTFDSDSGTASMYDDQHVYSEAGQFRPAPPSENKKKKDTEALIQVNKRTHDTFDPDDKNNQGNADPQDTSVYDDQHTYVKTPGSLVNTPPKKENVQTDVKIDENTQSDADLAKAAAQWKKQKEEKTANTTKSAVKAANTSAKANTTDFIDPKPYPNPNPVPLEKAGNGTIA